MGLNDTVSSERLHISIFGNRNAGKSSVVNAITNQELSVVSDVKGTTTDPVIKSMELLPLGPVLIIDTPGYDDIGELGEKRIEKTRQILRKTDIAVLVVDVSLGLDSYNEEIISLLNERKIPYIIAYNKVDIYQKNNNLNSNEINVSAITKEGINELKELIGKTSKSKTNEKKIVTDLLSDDDVVILVTPIDESAPKGRLILPQQQTIRELLDSHLPVIVCQVEELDKTISLLSKKPKLVITDSQAFDKVSKIVPDDIMLTSFSILFARYKGDLETLVNGVSKIKELNENSKVLISEGCTHHRQCNDIGSVKIPKFLEQYANRKFDFEFTSGGEFPSDIKKYSFIIHCGGCMLNEREMQYRIEYAKSHNIPITNYGVFLAQINGILFRSLEIFPELQDKLN